jgi:hypothetical protein
MSLSGIVMQTLNGSWESMTRVRYLTALQSVIEKQHNETYLYSMDLKAGHENNRTTKPTTRTSHACDKLFQTKLFSLLSGHGGFRASNS